MTVSYSGSFLRALFRWKGSLWKCVLISLAVWLSCYYVVRFLLIFVVPDTQRHSAKAIIRIFDNFTNRVPLQFLLGFYVVQTVTRWWAQIQSMPWPDDLISNINAMLYENDDDTKSKRKMIGRYIMLSFVLAWRTLSSAVKKKYANFDALIESGLLKQDEMDEVAKLQYVEHQYNLPLFWIYEIVRQKLGNQYSFVKELNTIRANFRTLLNYREICLPLVYTQTATTAVWGYFAICLVGHQYISFDKDDVSLEFPFMTVLMFIFSVGWLKVAEDLFHPFGNDDDDIEILRILERHARFIAEATDVPENLPLNSIQSDVQSFDPDVLFGKEAIVHIPKTKIMANSLKKQNSAEDLRIECA